MRGITSTRPMPRGRTDLTHYLNARVDGSLYEAVDAYADANDVSFSEAVRELLARGLDASGVRNNITDEHGITRAEKFSK